MKLVELKIRNIRGLTIFNNSPNGETFAIIGANGTGKSAVVDALDFLLTGDMNRLSGRRGFSLQRHGKYIKARTEDCFVEAKIILPGFSTPVSIRRSFSNPRNIVALPEALVRLKPFLTVAAQGHYVLTRTNILKFISAQPRDRAALVLAVLNINRIEEIRTILTRAANTETKKFNNARSNRIAAESVISKTLGLNIWGDEEALNVINRLRESLGGSPIAALANVKRDLTPPSTIASDQAAIPDKTVSDILGDIRRVGISVNDENEAQIDAWDEVLCTEATTLNSSPENALAARQIELVELGIKLLDDAAKCPLCDTDWDPGDLRGHLESKLEGGRAAAPSWKLLRSVADSMVGWLADTEESIGKIVTAGRLDDNGTDPAPLTLYATELKKLRKTLVDPLSQFLLYRESGKKLSEQLRISEARDLLRSLYGERVKSISRSPAQIAWDTLTRSEENLKVLVDTMKSTADALGSAQRLESLKESFIAARNVILDDLYNSVKERFVALYKQLHAPEEQQFEADMTPNEAGMSLEVDFHGTGKSAPFALHSDGHQDSMGLCLFLALTEKMQGTRLGFCLLDDVVMSIDAGHRRKVARLLKSLQPETQFMITTHDLVWAKQLLMEDCVTTKNIKHFIGWSLDGGAIEGSTIDFFAEVETALSNGNVRDAAASLRNGLESFFSVVADSIRARPIFSLSGFYEMGQMYIACNETLEKLVKMAKQSAMSWEQHDKVTALSEFDNRRSEARRNSQITGWAINANVHYNNWMDMTADEFRLVYEAFKEMCNLFKCETCGSILLVTLASAKPKTVTCAGNCVSWNLEKKQTS